jgi:hypothetical protein
LIPFFPYYEPAIFFKKNDSTDWLGHQGSWDTTVWCYSISHAVEINSDFFSFLFIQVYGIYCICFFINLNKQTVNCWSCVVGAFFLVCVQKEYELCYSFVSQPLNYELLTFLFAILCDCMQWQALLKPQVTATGTGNLPHIDGTTPTPYTGGSRVVGAATPPWRIVLAVAVLGLASAVLGVVAQFWGVLKLCCNQAAAAGAAG